MLTRDQLLEMFLDKAKDIPGEGLWVEASQILAETVEQAQSRLTELEIGTLVGVGALMARQGQREFAAGLHVGDFFSRIRKE